MSVFVHCPLSADSLSPAEQEGAALARPSSCRDGDLVEDLPEIVDHPPGPVRGEEQVAGLRYVRGEDKGPEQLLELGPEWDGPVAVSALQPAVLMRVEGDRQPVEANVVDLEVQDSCPPSACQQEGGEGRENLRLGPGM